MTALNHHLQPLTGANGRCFRPPRSLHPLCPTASITGTFQIGPGLGIAGVRRRGVEQPDREGTR